MVEKQKKEFSELLRKIDAIKIDALANCNNGLDEFFQNIEDDYRKIQYGVSTKLEDLKSISDILGQSHSSNNIEKPNDNTLKLVTTKAINKTNDYAFFEMKKKMIPFSLDKGKWLFEQGRIGKALDTWEEVLKINPDNKYVHSKLLEIMNLPQETRNRAEELQRKYRFKYIGSFGHNVLARPIAIIVGNEDDILFVSDEVSNQIHKFNVNGEYLGPLPIKVKRPLGFFKDIENNTWICDFGNCRLLALDYGGNELEEIRLKDILGESSGSIGPCFGCLRGDQFYLVLMESNWQKRRIISFNKHAPRDSFKILQYSDFQAPVDIKLVEKRIYVANFDPGSLFAYDFNLKEFVRITWEPVPGTPRQFVTANNELFLNAGTFLVKMSLKGRQIFLANVSQVLGTNNIIVGAAIAEKENKRILLLTDLTQASVHSFLV